MRLGLPRRLGDWVLAVGATTLTLVLLTSLALVLAVQSLEHSAERARHSNEVLVAAHAAENLVLDVETGSRGFLVADSPAFLAPWISGRRELPGALSRLRALVRDDPLQSTRAGLATRQIDAYVSRYSVPLVALGRRSLTRARGVVRTQEGKRRVDAIRATFRRIFSTETGLAGARKASAQNRAVLAYAVVAVAGVLALLAAGLLILFTRRQIVGPLQDLEGAARRLAEGDLSVRSTSRGGRSADEVAALGVAFDTMAASLEAERDRLARANVELSRSNTELEEFAYVASHDLSEPLRVVAGFTDLLARRSADVLSEDSKGYVARILSGTERMQQLIDDLLRYSRVGRAELDLGPQELGPIVMEALERLEVARREARAEVEIGALPTVLGDARQLSVVFQNLLSNAIKFRRPGEDPLHVRVTGETEDGTAVVRVEDDGIGIAPEHRERIFRMFQRLHTRAEYPGTGIGLALCQRILDRHGGSIEVEAAQSEGARFVLRLPAAIKA